MPAPQSLPSRLIGALFVERGLVSESQIRVALEIQRETGQQFGQRLVERFGVSRKELASVVAEQWAKLGGSAGPEDTASWRRLGDIFVERGFVTQEELDEALVRQRQTGERLGEALVAQGVISKFELAGALAEQMAVLGDTGAEEAVENGQPEATVHHLHARDDTENAPPARNVIGLAAPIEWGRMEVEPDQPPLELHEAFLAEVGYANETAPEPDPRTACVAFAPTTDGYRLVALEAAPEPGETIDIAEVGEYLVLRVGRSPIPGDDRRCAYVEERVTPALIGAVAH